MCNGASLILCQYSTLQSVPIKKWALARMRYSKRWTSYTCMLVFDFSTESKQLLLLELRLKFNKHFKIYKSSPVLPHGFTHPFPLPQTHLCIPAHLFADLFALQLCNYILMKNSLEKENKIILKTDDCSYQLPCAAAQTLQSIQKSTLALVATPASDLVALNTVFSL